MAAVVPGSQLSLLERLSREVRQICLRPVSSLSVALQLHIEIAFRIAYGGGERAGEDMMSFLS